MERRLMALEARLGAAKPAHKGPACTKCGAPGQVIDEVDDPMYGPMGHKRITAICQNPSCGHRFDRKIAPNA
jgi:hypothetical protein